MKARPFLLKQRISSNWSPAMAFYSIVTILSSPLHAADVTWDTATGDSAVTGGAGTWDTTNSNWTTDVGLTNTSWNNGNNDTALFVGTAGAVTLGANVIVGGLQFNTNNYSIAAGAGPYTITFGAPGDVNVGTGTTTISANLASSSGLSKTGSGTLILRGLGNSITGNTSITGGTLQIGDHTASSIGGASYSGDISIAGGASLHIKSTSAQTFSGVISGDGDFRTSGDGRITLTGANTYTGKTMITTLTSGDPSVSISSFNSVFTNATLGTVHSASSSLGAPTTVANGTIDFGAGSQRGHTIVYTGNGETTDRVLNITMNGNGATKTIENAGSGLLKFTSTFTFSGSTNNDFNLAGVGNGEIVGGLNYTLRNFTKNGTGTWTLGAAVGTTATTTVNAGTLILEDGISTTGAFVVKNNATLGGSGSFGGAISIENGGTLSPGNSAGQFNVTTSLTLAASSNTYMELGGTTLGTQYDNITIDIAGALTYGGNLDVVNFGLYDMDLATYTYDLFTLNGATPAGDFASVTVNSISLLNNSGVWTGSNGGVTYEFDQAFGDLTVTAIPEPRAALLGALGLLALLRRRR